MSGTGERAAFNPPLLFRRAQAEDAAELTEIAQAAKRHWGYPAEWMEAWREELTITAEMIRRHQVGLAELGGKIIGTYSLINDAGGWHLEHFWLQPAHIGRGLGRALFAEAVRQARALGLSELRIKSDPNAEPFYLKMGAVRTGLEVCQLLGKIRREVPLLSYRVPAALDLANPAEFAEGG